MRHTPFTALPGTSKMVLQLRNAFLMRLMPTVPFKYSLWPSIAASQKIWALKFKCGQLIIQSRIYGLTCSCSSCQSNGLGPCYCTDLQLVHTLFQRLCRHTTSIDPGVIVGRECLFILLPNEVSFPFSVCAVRFLLLFMIFLPWPSFWPDTDIYLRCL